MKIAPANKNYCGPHRPSRLSQTALRQPQSAVNAPWPTGEVCPIAPARSREYVLGVKRMKSESMKLIKYECKRVPLAPITEFSRPPNACACLMRQTGEPSERFAPGEGL